MIGRSWANSLVFGVHLVFSAYFWGFDSTGHKLVLIGASFAVHGDMRSHPRGFMNLGKGCIYWTSIHQKLNIKILTKANLVGVSEILPQFIWTRYLFEDQWYQIESSIVYQDNMSEIRMEKNRLELSSKRTHHINIIYFFKNDRFGRKEISIEYCPTDDIIAVFY